MERNGTEWPGVAGNLPGKAWNTFVTARNGRKWLELGLQVGVAGLGPAVALRKIMLFQTDAASTPAD